MPAATATAPDNRDRGRGAVGAEGADDGTAGAEDDAPVAAGDVAVAPAPGVLVASSPGIGRFSSNARPGAKIPPSYLRRSEIASGLPARRPCSSTLLSWSSFA